LSSKRVKTQSCSLNEQFGPDFWLKSSENRSKKKYLDEVLTYTAFEDDARKAVIKDIADKNPLLRTELLLRFRTGAPLRDEGDNIYYDAFSKRINQIMKCEGKDGHSLEDLIDLKYDLEDSKKRKKILASYFIQHKR
jgi:hypothetical protein